MRATDCHNVDEYNPPPKMKQWRVKTPFWKLPVLLLLHGHRPWHVNVLEATVRLQIPKLFPDECVISNVHAPARFIHRLLRYVPFLLLGIRCGWPQAPNSPNTPAGLTMRAWLDAFNRGDRDSIQTYLSKYEPTKDLDGQIAFRQQTGGFELLSIDKSERLHIEFRVREKNSTTIALGKIDVKGDPAVVVRFSLLAIPPGVTSADIVSKIDAVARKRVINGAITNLNEFYVYPETAKKMEAALRDHQNRGDYDAVDDGDAFANLLTAHLDEVSHDKHLHISFSPWVLPQNGSSRSPDSETQMRAQLERNNCAFDKAERLPANIVYLKFNAFFPPSICGPTAAAAMNFLGNVDAIIFDLRDNGGGDPDMIAFLSMYLFNEPTHLNDLYDRKEDSTTQHWTLPYVPGKRLAGKQVFVLTSKRTFSGAEEFSYNLKNLKRATIVGEVTGGGAHPVSGHRIDDHFQIRVPFARAVSPITKTNWEGTGVEPDIKVPADEALDVAKKMAADQLRNDQLKKK